jgi:cobalamin-dependent methionine synthase I
LTGHSTKQQYDLSMQEAQDVYWTIETNQFGLNIAEAFSEAVHRVVVIDPGIKVRMCFYFKQLNFYWFYCILSFHY